jgi:hypothetical protein
MSDALRARIVAEAHRLVGTRYLAQHNDCAQAVLTALVAAGVPGAAAVQASEAARTYGPQSPRDGLLRALLAAGCRQMRVPEARPGDLLLKLVEHRPQHLGVIVEGRCMIHADDRVKRIVGPTRIPPSWRGSGATAFELPGVDR